MRNFKVGQYKVIHKGSDYEYKSFIPSKINKTFIFEEPRIMVLLEKASQALSELNTYSILTPDINFFIKMHVVKEANSSSSIEGTKTEMDEVLMNVEDINPEKRDDWREVHNYIKAMNFGIDKLKDLPLSMRLLNEIHTYLLAGVRGERKQPGQIRKTPNWIGGSSINNAFYIPPPPEELPDLLTDLEKFINNEELPIPVLLKSAIIHYQFETIHPYLDGNGRIGRLLITLTLIESGFLRKPVLYISDYFANNKNKYYDCLTDVRINGSLSSWIIFFLTAVLESAEKSKTKLEKLVFLKQNCEDRLIQLNKKSLHARKILDSLYSDPIITLEKAQKILNLTKSPASRVLKDLVKTGILKGLEESKRNRFLVFSDYLNIFEKTK